MAAERCSVLEIRWALIEASRRFTRPRESRHHARDGLERIAQVAVAAHSEPDWLTALYNEGLVGELVRDTETETRGVDIMAKYSSHNFNLADRPPRHDVMTDGPLKGTVVRVFSGESDYGPWEAAEIQDDHRGLVTVFARGVVMQNALKTAGPRDPISIEYLGLVESQNGRRYHDYNIEVG